VLSVIGASWPLRWISFVGRWRRHLRRLYPDPITNSAERGLVKAPDGGVMGVYSLSEQPVLKTGNFRVVDHSLEGGKNLLRLEVLPHALTAVRSQTRPAKVVVVLATWRLQTLGRLSRSVGGQENGRRDKLDNVTRLHFNK